MAIAPPLSRNAYGAPRSHTDRLTERSLRDKIRKEVDRLLAERELLVPGRDEEDRIRALIHEQVAASQRRAAETNEPLLSDPEGVEVRLFNDLLRLGLLQPLMEDPTIEEILVNGPGRVFVIQDGRKRLIDDLFFDEDEDLRALVKRLIGPLGRRLDESSPMVEARLADGSRLNAAIPPVTGGDTYVTIRKFILRANTLQQLVTFGSLTEAAAQFLDASVQAGLNIVVSGPTGSGKTTMLNCLGACIASLDERIVTAEEVGELQLQQHLPDCVSLYARAGNLEGVGEVRVRDLVKNALRMRPTRILVGEVRGGESLDMILCMNTGHDGSLTTVHGNSPRDALERLTTLAMMAEERLSYEALSRMVARTIDLVVQLRFDALTRRRRVQSIFEVGGMEGDVTTGNELWLIDPATDKLTWTGIRPRSLARMAAKGVDYAPPPSEVRA